MNYFLISCCLIMLLPSNSEAQMSDSGNDIKSKHNNTEPTGVIYGFLEWYKNNYIRLYEYRLTVTDSSGNYQVDKKACEGYLSELKASGFISDEYLKLWNRYFDDQSVKFKMYTQNEGPPEGFDFDLVLHTQEPEVVCKVLKNMKFTYKEKSDGKVVVHADTGWPDWIYVFELTRINHHWYIDYISLKEPE
jgi:hypothetical protein